MKKTIFILLTIFLAGTTIVLYIKKADFAFIFIAFVSMMGTLYGAIYVPKQGDVSVSAGNDIDRLNVHSKGDANVEAGRNISRTEINTKDSKRNKK